MTSTLTSSTDGPVGAEPLDATPAPHDVPAPIGALAGLVAAGAAIATGEVFSGFSRRIPSLLVAIFDVLVDYSPTDVVRWSRETFGTNQKSITITGITVVTLALGVLVGIVARRHPRVGTGAFVAFGLVGGWAAARSPLSSGSWSWLSALAATAVGALTLRGALRAAADDEPSATGGLLATAERRRFLGIVGGAAFWGLFGTGLGRALRSNQSVEGARAQVAADLGVGAATPPAFTGLNDIEDLSPLITPNDDFYLIDTAFSPPQVDPADWSLTIKGMVDNEITLTFDELAAMEQMEAVVTLSCVSNEVGGHLVGNAVWTGVSLPALLDMAGVQEGATQIVGRSVDDWTGGFPTEVAFDGRPAMVALTMNGEPLPIHHGFPARLVIPGLYGYVSATKWLSEIELTTWEDFDGYWVPRGWSKVGPIKTQSRIDVPHRNDELIAGTNAIAGVAWAGHRSVDRVEVRVDEGPWQEATLSEELSENSWRQWMLAWDAEPGEHVIEVRATDGDGVTQTDEIARPDPDGATGHHSVKVTVVQP